MVATKTTFHLDRELRTRLKIVAARQGKTVTDLLAEGAKLVIDRYQGVADHEELKRRSREMWERLRGGLYRGSGASDRVDALVYGVPPRARNQPRRRTR
jgi:hypothetical protein